MKQYKYVFIPMQNLANDGDAIKNFADTVKDFGEQGWLYIGTKPLLDASLAIFEREAIVEVTMKKTGGVFETECPLCNGTGEDDQLDCLECGGTGMVEVVKGQAGA